MQTEKDFVEKLECIQFSICVREQVENFLDALETLCKKFSIDGSYSFIFKVAKLGKLEYKLFSICVRKDKVVNFLDGLEILCKKFSVDGSYEYLFNITTL